MIFKIIILKYPNPKKQFVFLSDASEDFTVSSVALLPPESLSLSVFNNKGAKLRVKKSLRVGWMARRGRPLDMTLGRIV